jgi:hypothetical protein
MSVTDDLTKKLVLLQTASLQQAKDWSKRTRELMKEGCSADQAAIKAATTVFVAAVFKPTNYKYDRPEDPKGSVGELLKAIDEQHKN